MKVYLIGSLRNSAVPDLANVMRKLGLDVFDDWHAAGPEADDKWQEYENRRGRSYKEALKGAFAQNGFNFDKRNIDDSDAVVMLMPAGKSGHLELGYAAGLGKKAYILFDKEPERYDLMYNFATDIFFRVEELFEALVPQQSVFNAAKLSDEELTKIILDTQPTVIEPLPEIVVAQPEKTTATGYTDAELQLQALADGMLRK